jgi:hypothetical protein
MKSKLHNALPGGGSTDRRPARVEEMWGGGARKGLPHHNHQRRLQVVFNTMLLRPETQTRAVH